MLVILGSVGVFFWRDVMMHAIEDVGVNLLDEDIKGWWWIEPGPLQPQQVRSICRYLESQQRIAAAPCEHAGQDV